VKRAAGRVPAQPARLNVSATTPWPANAASTMQQYRQRDVDVVFRFGWSDPSGSHECGLRPPDSPIRDGWGSATDSRPYRRRPPCDRRPSAPWWYFTSPSRSRPFVFGRVLFAAASNSAEDRFVRDVHDVRQDVEPAGCAMPMTVMRVRCAVAARFHEVEHRPRHVEPLDRESLLRRGKALWQEALERVHGR